MFTHAKKFVQFDRDGVLLLRGQLRKKIERTIAVLNSLSVDRRVDYGATRVGLINSEFASFSRLVLASHSEA